MSSQTVPIRYDERGGLFVDVRLDDREVVSMILDTGASRSTLSPRAADRLGIRRAGDTSRIAGTAGHVTAESGTARAEIPGLPPLDIDFAVYDFGSYDPACEGILGFEFLERAPFAILYRSRTLVWEANAPRNVLAMKLDGRIPRLGVEINGKPLELRLDSGATFPPSEIPYLNVTEAQARTLGLAGPPEKSFSATGTGGATLTLPVYPIANLSIGGCDLGRGYAIVQPPTGYFARPEAVGFLGNAVLDKLDPFFDYRGGCFGFEEPGPAGGGFLYRGGGGC